MNCQEAMAQLQLLLDGRVHGEAAAQVRLHLASCTSCFAALPEMDRVEVIPVLDVSVEPSPDLSERFKRRLRAHRAQSLPADKPAWWGELSRPWRLAAIGALAAALLLAAYLGTYRGTAPPEMAGDLSIAANLPLLEDMEVIDNLDLIEDFEAIEGLSATGAPQSRP